MWLSSMLIIVYGPMNLFCKLLLMFFFFFSLRYHTLSPILKLQPAITRLVFNCAFSIRILLFVRTDEYACLSVIFNFSE